MWTDALSLKGKRLDFYSRAEAYVSLTNAIPELSRFTVCIDLRFVGAKSSDWMAFSYITKNAFLGREDIDLGLSGDHQQLIVYNLGKTFYIRYDLTPFQWHTVCLLWDGVKGRLEVFLNRERKLVMINQPQNLAPNGTLVLGYFLKKGDDQVKRMVPRFTNSLYYFQLWDHILGNEEFMKCLSGNVVSWEEDVWLVNKIIPTVDIRLRCFVSENIAIQETTTALSQQTDLITPFQVTGLKPQKTVYSSTVVSKSMPVFATDYITRWYSNISPPLETMTAPIILKTSIAETATFAADILSTSAAIALSTKSTSIDPTTNSMKISKSPSSETMETTKMAESIATETFHPRVATNFLYTSGSTKNSIASEPPVTGSQSAVMRTASLFSSIESTSMSTTSWPKYKSTGIGAFPISTASKEFLASTAAGSVPQSTVDQTSATTTHIGTASAQPPESVLLSTSAPVDSVFSRNQTASILATTDMEIPFTVYSTRSIEMTPARRTVETELTSTNFQDVSSPRVEDTTSTSVPTEASSMTLSFRTSSPFTRAQSIQTVIDAGTTHTALTPGITLAPTVAETMLSPTLAGPVYTQNTPSGGENMLPLISTRSASTSKASESGPTSITDEGNNLSSTNEVIWTSRPEQTLLTLAFHGSTSNTEHSPTTTNIIIQPEASKESEATTSDITTDRYTTVLSKLISPRFANFSTVSGAISVTKLPECKLTTLLLKPTPVPTVARHDLSTPKETVVPPDRISTLAYVEPNFSTEESASENTQTETNDTIAFGETTAPIPESATTQRFSATVTRKETASHHLKGKSTLAATTEVSPFVTILEATDESVSPFPDVEKLTTQLDNTTATTEVRGSWFSSKSVKNTPNSSPNGTTEIFNSTHIHTAHWTSETLPEGSPAPSPTSGSIQTFPGPLGASTTRLLKTGFAAIPTHRTAMSLPAGTLPPQPTHSSVTPVPITYVFSLPVNVSAVTSVVVSEETKVTMPRPSTLARAFSTSMPSAVSTLPSATVTTASVPPLDETTSTTSGTMLSHRDSIHTTSEATGISVRMTPTAVPSLTETPVRSLRPPTSVATKAETTLLSTSADTVTPSRPTLACSKPLPDNTPAVSSTHITSTMSTISATQPIAQVEETSTRALSFPYTFSGSGDVVSLATGTTETSVVDDAMPSHTSANKLIASVYGHVSPSSTRLVNTLVPTLLVTDISTLSYDKEKMTTSLGKTPRTLKVTEMSPSKNPFISDSHSASSLEMTDTGFSEATKISSHQTHSLSETPFVTSPNENSASSPTSGSTQIPPTSTSSNTVDVHISEVSTSLGKTALPSQALTITTPLSPERESTSALSVYTPRTEKKIVSTTSVTHPFSHHQDTSFVDTLTSGTTRISNPVNNNTTLSHLLSSRAQPVVSSVASPISESTQTSPETPSLSTPRLSSANFTAMSTDRITTVLSTSNVPTALLGKTSMATSIPIYQMSPWPVSATAFTSKIVADTPTVLMTESSKTAHADCLKSPSVASSGPVPEMSSMSVNDSAFPSPAVSSDASATGGSFYTLLSSVTPRPSMTMQTSTLDVTPVTYAGSTSKSTVASSAFTTSEITEVSSRIIPTSFSSPTEPTFPSVKTIPTTIMAGIVTTFVSTPASPLPSSKNTEALSSIPKTTFSPLLSTSRQSSQGYEATTLGIFSGITNSSPSTVSSGKVTALTNTYPRTATPESVLSSTPSENLHTSLNIQVSPSLAGFKSTPGLTKCVKATTYHSSNTEKKTSLSESTLTSKLTKGATSAHAPVSYPPWIPSSTDPPSLTSFVFSPQSTEAEFSTPKTSLPPTSQIVEFPVLRTRTTSSNTQPLLMTSGNTPTAEDSQLSTSTTAHASTPNKVETESPSLVPESLSTFTATQTGLVSGGVMAMSSISTTGILPTSGMSESPSLSISSRSIPTTLADIKHTFEKTTTSVTPGTTLPSNPSGAASESIISKAATSPMLTRILPSLPSGSPLATIFNTPHILFSSPVEVSKSTFLTSDMTPTLPFTNFTTRPFAGVSAILTKTTPSPTVGSITTGFPSSFPMSIKITDDSTYISKSPEAFSRIALTANSRTVSQAPSFSRMSKSPPTTDHTLSIGAMLLSSPTTTSAWSRIPAASASPTLVLPKFTQDSLLNIATTTSTATGAPFPLISTGVTHPSTATVSSLPSSSFEAIWLDSTPSFLSMETSTSSIAVKSEVSFYNIEMIFSVFDEEPRIPISSVVKEFAKNWLTSIFQDSEFVLANLAVQIKSRDTTEEEIIMDRTFVSKREGQGMATISHVPYSCACQVIIKANSSLATTKLISRIKSKIHGNLTHGNFTQDQLMLLVKSEYVAVKKLEPGKCQAEETASKYKGTYKWLLTNPMETAQTRCIKNEDESATRICSISINTGKSHWEKPKFKQCKLLQALPNKIVDLANITISDENADDVAEHILNLINESTILDEEETKIIVSKVSDISQCDEISMNLTQTILQIISAALGKQNNSASGLHEVSNEILMIIERAGHKMEFLGRTANLTVANLALAVLQVDHTFEGMAFSIHSYEESTDPEISLGEVPLGRVLASIYLPKSLRERIPLSHLHTILFNFFGQTSLFKTQNVAKALSTYVVSASISDTSIQNLADPVVITLQHVEENQNYDQVQCAFWDFGNNNGQGGWNSSGCKVKETNVNYTICQCDHLTHFGVLMDLSRSAVDAVNERILVLITYIGCGISSIFLGVAIVTYIAFHKLRKDYPSKILINLCTALLMLNLVFLVNSWSSSFQKLGLCITAAAALHYFLLVSLTWMGLEAVHMYFALVKVFNIYIPNYILKFCLVGWGIPAIVVAIILSVKKDLYGTLSSTTPFCWIKDDPIFYISVVAYFCLVFLINLSMFCTVLVQLNSMKSQSLKTRRKMILHDLKGTTSLTFLLGLTWGFAFFAWGPVRIIFLYLFAIFNTLQGFLIFVFHCVMKERVREQWQLLFCCGWLRLGTDGSSRCGLNVGQKQERLRKTFAHNLWTPSAKSTATSSIFKSLGSAQGTPSEMSFPNDDFDEDPNCFSPLSCEAVPNCTPITSLMGMNFSTKTAPEGTAGRALRKGTEQELSEAGGSS
ncbi:adhesion G-protein coupled receptor G4 [Hippopotamus amphibius kiboko]|uniref:adhesion G-protein coupled receptor G4 n=1 Tax=Hippopotamus amphibius kiboko TaxID=575201 RepID=UPI002592C670|nr:adhesion G-protein coupled receptor G4 [Hippopotamus amphibius kiboko]